jgi:hypothetical protein
VSTSRTHRSVAELALRGRLVARREDEPAWGSAPLGKLAQLSIGRTPPTGSSDMWARGDGDGHAWVTIADLTRANGEGGGGVVHTTGRRVSARAAEEVFRRPVLPPGTLLMSFKLTLGQVAVLGQSAFHNEAIVAIVPHEPALQPFLHLVLPAIVRRALPRAALKGATLNRAALEGLLVPLPSAAEQARIVARAQRLGALDDELARARRREAELGARLTASVFGDARADAALLTGSLATLVDRANKVRPFEQAILHLALAGRFTGGTVGWRPQRLDEIARWAGGSGFPREAQGHGDRPILFCKVSDMSLPENARHVVRTVHTVDASTARRLGAKVHPAGTVVFPKTGGAIATNRRRILGRPAAIDNNCLGLVPDESCSPELLYLVLRAIDMTRYQSSGPVPALNQARLAGIVVQVPPRAEQAALVARVERLLELSSALATSLTRAEIYETRLARASERSLFTSPAGESASTVAAPRHGPR